MQITKKEVTEKEWFDSKKDRHYEIIRIAFVRRFDFDQAKVINIIIGPLMLTLGYLSEKS